MDTESQSRVMLLRESHKNVIQFATLCVSNNFSATSLKFEEDGSDIECKKVMMTSLNSSFRRPEAAHSPINTQGCERTIAKR